jgi:hypothetical protein
MHLLCLLRGALLHSVLERQKLLRAEGLVVNLGSCLNQILQVGAGKEVAQVHKLAVGRVLDVDHAPAIPATPDRLAVNHHVIFRADYGKWNDPLNGT